MLVGDRYDVVVVGGGPAGSMAAKQSALGGAKTLLLERDSNIGVPVRCGEAVSLRNLERFITVQENWCAARVQGMVLHSPDETAVTVNSTEMGVVLERALFDRWLAEQAAQSGADILTRADVDGLLMNGDGVTGVKYRRFGKTQAVVAQVVIGADGVESRVGRWAGIRTQLAARDFESAYQMVLAGINYDHRYCHFYLGNNIAPGGYLWIFPKGEHTASVGIGVCAKDCSAGEAYDKLLEFIHRHFGKPAVVGEMAGGVPVGKPLKNPVTEGLLLAGDAARHCNPLTGGGIATAMIAGFHAGTVAAEAVKNGNASARRLGRFNNLIEDDIVKPNKRAYRLAEAVGKLSDETMNWTAREMLAMPENQRNLRSIFLKGLSTQPLLMVDIIKAFA